MLANAFLLLLGSSLFTLRLGSGSFPRVLSSGEENEYVARSCAGDQEARNILIEHNLRLVAHIIKKYYSAEQDIDDLISIGTIGLIKGISTYRPEKGVRLATYASRCIENEILMHFRSAKKYALDLSLSETIDDDSDSGALSLMDVLAEDDDLAERIGNEELCRSLRRSVETVLEPRERQIIALRYGLEQGEPLTQKETAAHCGISRSYVSRIEKRALEKLRRHLEKESPP